MQISDLLILLAALMVAGAVLGAAAQVSHAIGAARQEAVSARAASLLATFSAALGEADDDPRAILKWAPIARVARQVWPREFALLDQANGGSFPFSRELLEAAHARWTTDWLAWERTHDTEYRLKAALAEQELAASANAPHARARADAVEREKLDLYQRRYAEYIRVAKGLQALL